VQALPQAAAVAAAAAGENVEAAAQERMVERGGVQYGTYPLVWSPERYDNAGPWLRTRRSSSTAWATRK
jgi:hypothetical protein